MKKLTKPQCLWIEALKSGKYKKGVDYLCVDEKSCCLGVACEIYSQTNRKLSKEIDSEDGCTQYANHKTDLPKEVSEWLGMGFRRQGEFLSDKIIRARGIRCHHSLSSLNNNSTLNLEEIGNIIDQHREMVFE